MARVWPPGGATIVVAGRDAAKERDGGAGTSDLGAKASAIPVDVLKETPAAR
jgi:hypothetical protein